MDNQEKDRLRQMLLERSMRFGEFVLSSGATSSYYIDVRKTSLHPEGLRLISRAFWEILEADHVTAGGGLTMGADPLVAGVMLHSLEVGKPIEGFLVRRTAKDHGMKGQVEGNLAGHKRIFVLRLELQVGRIRPVRRGVVVGGRLKIRATLLLVLADGEEVFAA